MPFPTAYTPLESLLLFQALRSEGVTAHAVFNRISEQLKNISFVRDDPTFDGGRLSPDALRDLYLWLLKEEVKRDLQTQVEREALLQNGSLSPGKRKRKAESPELPTVQEATQHAHLIPQLVTRLYARYREHTVREIREYERKYHATKREVGEIENGKWDERLERRRTATQSPQPSTSTQSAAGSKDANAVVPAKSASNATPNLAAATSKPYKGNKIGDVINHGPEPKNGLDQHRRTSSGTVLPPLSEMAPQSPRFGIPPKVAGPLSTQVPNHGFNGQSPPSGHQSPYRSHHGHPAPVTVASPQIQNPSSRPSSSPRPILPPPPGMKLPPPSPVQDNASPSLRGPSQHVPQQYPPPPPHRLSTGASPTLERQHFDYATQPQQHYVPPAQHGYYQGQTYQDRRISYPQPHGQPAYAVQNHPVGGYQLPPYSVDSSQSVPQQQGQMYGQQMPQYPQHPPSAPATMHRSGPADNQVARIISALGTPSRQGRNGTFKRPTNLDFGTPEESPSVVEIEPLSPVLKRSEPAGRSTRATRNRGTVDSEQSAEPEPPAKSTRTRGRAKRDRSPHSVVSSMADESTHVRRSQSVCTAAGAIPMSDDRPSSRNHVKIEPSTPAAFVEIPEAPHEHPSGSGAGPMTRKRRGTLQTHPQPPSKRTRQHSPDRHAPQDSWPTPPPPSNTVTATRNFHKMSTTIMNDINSHKHASYFAKPVQDKDAPGYSEIIKMPQNLKSIRAAIAAGAKAVNAATASTDSPSAAGESSTVELERSVELIPPKAIVNGAQLEKEIMRIFANAVMFNPGDDGMVSSTREMFENVEGMIAQWRGAEKEVGEGGAADVVEEEGRDKGRRRKL